MKVARCLCSLSDHLLACGPQMCICIVSLMWPECLDRLPGTLQTSQQGHVAGSAQLAVGTRLTFRPLVYFLYTLRHTLRTCELTPFCRTGPPLQAMVKWTWLLSLIDWSGLQHGLWREVTDNKTDSISL